MIRRYQLDKMIPNHHHLLCLDYKKKPPQRQDLGQWHTRWRGEFNAAELHVTISPRQSMVTPRIPRMCARILTHRVIKRREKTRLKEMEPRDRLLKFARAQIDQTNRGVLLLRRGCVTGRKKEGRGRQEGGRPGCVGSRSRRGDSVEMNGKGLTLRNITPIRRPHPRFPAQGCDPFKPPWSKQQQQQKI